uniref:Uncharacterized protein n=1 Tax=Ditylum brightwellii TaxID=49249 RepID=A0A6U3PTY6_9STRA|mmetsp:Transcript_16202/g.24019  ORF Transcript_16202/g.24019 Transcript_16202/m.24019 type:complete len:227 (+) Transcript_16202:203-883(+)
MRFHKRPWINTATTALPKHPQRPITKPLQTFHQSFSSGNRDIAINAPPPPTQSWERSAKLVKNTTVSNKYLEHIRDVHDPSQHVKTIEDELRGTMGKALGKQGHKVMSEIQCMDKEKALYDALVARYLEQNSMSLKEGIIQHAQQYNEARKRAIKARWELLVHRQAVGFTVGNHDVVNKMFVIEEALPLEMPSSSPNEKEKEKEEKPKKEVFGNQLDWWQRIGRWK